MTKTQLENLVADLMKQISTQGDLLSALIEKQLIDPQQPQQQQEEPPRRRASSRKEESDESRARRRLKELRREILSRFGKSTPRQHNNLPDFRRFVERNDIDSLEEISLPLFCGLVSKYLSPPLADAFFHRQIAESLFPRIVRFVDLGLEENELDIDDEVRARATHYEEEEKKRRETEQQPVVLAPSPGPFSLPGRDELERFLNDHVVDLVNNHANYLALGIDFPSSFILEGPPGCGKTYAAERLAEHLGWTVFHVNSASIGSSYIHETSKKIEETFEKAAKAAPAIVIIDEMDAFTPDRASMAHSNDHRHEEVASFLRCLQDAARHRVLVIGMTNLIDRVDPAIRRTGRMGTHITLGMPSLQEVEAVMSVALAKRPHEDFPLTPFATQLLEHPLSDITAAVDTAAMAAARARRSMLTANDLTTAIETIDARHYAPMRAAIGFAQ